MRVGGDLLNPPIQERSERRNFSQVISQYDIKRVHRRAGFLGWVDKPVASTCYEVDRRDGVLSFKIHWPATDGQRSQSEADWQIRRIGDRHGTRDLNERSDLAIRGVAPTDDS